jgi:hypothetical protein
VCSFHKEDTHVGDIGVEILDIWAGNGEKPLRKGLFLVEKRRGNLFTQTVKGVATYRFAEILKLAHIGR